MTAEKAIEILSDVGDINRCCEEDTEALDMAIKALERASCIKEKCAYCPHCEHCDVDDETLAIKALEQQPKTGHWIEKDDFDGDTYYDCSECGESFCLIDGTPTDNLYNYCPNCGAKMEGE